MKRAEAKMVPGRVLVGGKPEKHVFWPRVVAVGRDGARNDFRACLEVQEVA